MNGPEVYKSKTTIKKSHASTCVEIEINIVGKLVDMIIGDMKNIKGKSINASIDIEINKSATEILKIPSFVNMINITLFDFR